MVYRVHGGSGGEGTCIWAPALMPALKMFLTTRVNTFLGCTNPSVAYIYGDVFISDFSIMCGLLRGRAQLLLLFTYLFLAVRSVGCVRAFSAVAEGGAALMALRRLLLCGTRAPGCLRFRGCGTGAWLLQDMWGLPRSGVKPVSPKLADRFFTMEPLREVPKSYSLLSPASTGSHLTVRNID